MAIKVLAIHHDQDAECPMTEWDNQWKLVSFRRHSIHHGPIEDYLVNTLQGDVRFKTNALRQKYNRGLAFILDYFEHGEGNYSLHGEGMQDRWDTSRYAGVLIWEHAVNELGAKTPEDRAEDARQFLETYNNWANGHVYGYSLSDINGKEIDTCWGYFETHSMSQQICGALEPGDQLILLNTDCSFAFEESELPANVTLITSQVKYCHLLKDDVDYEYPGLNTTADEPATSTALLTATTSGLDRLTEPRTRRIGKLRKRTEHDTEEE